MTPIVSRPTLSQPLALTIPLSQHLLLRLAALTPGPVDAVDTLAIVAREASDDLCSQPSSQALTVGALELFIR